MVIGNSLMFDYWVILNSLCCLAHLIMCTKLDHSLCLACPRLSHRSQTFCLHLVTSFLEVAVWYYWLGIYVHISVCRLCSILCYHPSANDSYCPSQVGPDRPTYSQSGFRVPNPWNPPNILWTRLSCGIPSQSDSSIFLACQAGGLAFAALSLEFYSNLWWIQTCLC